LWREAGQHKAGEKREMKKDLSNKKLLENENDIRVQFPRRIIRENDEKSFSPIKHQRGRTKEG